MKVYAGFDPVSGKRHDLDEVVPAGPRAAAERIRTRLLHEVDEQRDPKTRATVNQLLDRHLETLDVEPTTRTRNERIVRIHLWPALGSLPLSKLDGDIRLNRARGRRFPQELRHDRLGWVRVTPRGQRPVEPSALVTWASRRGEVAARSAGLDGASSLWTFRSIVLRSPCP